MGMSLIEVPLGHGDSAAGTVAKFDPRIAAGLIGTDQFFAVLDIVRDDKMGVLSQEGRW